MSLFTIQLAGKKAKPIEIQDRSLDDGFDSKEELIFTTVVNGSFNALICTPKGVTVFDGVDTEEDATHEFHCEYPGFEITAEQWVLLPGKSQRFRILRVKNCCEADDRIVIQCTERGATDKAAANA